MLLHFFFIFTVDIRTTFIAYYIIQCRNSVQNQKTKGAKNAIRLDDHSSRIIKTQRRYAKMVFDIRNANK